MLTVEKACCCISLRTGTILIGWLGMMLYIASSVCLATFMTAPDDELWFGVLAVLTALSMIHVLDNLALIVGTLKKVPQLLLPWIFVQIIIMIVFIVFAVLVCLAKNKPTVIVVTTSIIALFDVLHAYLVICVYSMYRRIRDVRQHEAYGKAPSPY